MLSSLHVNVTCRCEGCYEGYSPNTDHIRCLSNNQISHFDSDLQYYIIDLSILLKCCSMVDLASKYSSVHDRRRGGRALLILAVAVHYYSWKLYL